MKRGLTDPVKEEQLKRFNDEQGLVEKMDTLKNQFEEFTSVDVAQTNAQQQGLVLPKLFYVDREARAHAMHKIEFFMKKDDARDYARLHGNLPMWSVDKFSGNGGNAGAKYFVVASYDEFYSFYGNCERPTNGGPNFASDKRWKQYDLIKSLGGLSYDEVEERKRECGNKEECNMITSIRSLSAEDVEKLKMTCLKEILVVYPFAYEVIMEGVPLHLYLDMEGSKTTNPGVDFNALGSAILGELRRFMSDFNIGGPFSKPVLIYLDSSTDAKFSKHVVYKIPGCVFENNYVCGALMRNFHLHLINRYGQPSSNRFYVNPPGDAKSKTKICILDFAVYTKFRDFRLIGSCKRKGCSNPNTPLRWLWLQGKKKQLSKELFLQCLIQNTHGDEIIQTIGSSIFDTINGGIPYSSSLRTAQPLNPTVVGGNRSVVATGPSSDFSVVVALELPTQLKKRLEDFGKRVGQFLSSVKKDPFQQYFRDGAKVTKIILRSLRDGNYAWSIETTCSYCLIRKDKMGDPKHKPGGRTSTFLIWATGLCKGGTYDESKVGGIKQMCIANSCTGGIGPSKPAWTGYIGDGLPEELRNTINDILRPCIRSEIARLGLWSVQPSNRPDGGVGEGLQKKNKIDDDDVCLFDEDDE
jgi:hypothetical protein